MVSITALQGANLANQVYSDLTVGGDVLDFYTDPATDLQMALLQFGDRKVVAFRGTFSFADVGTDIGMFGASFIAGLADQFTGIQ